MDPTVIVAIISTAGKLAEKLIGSWKSHPSNQSEDKKLEKKADEVAKKHYTALRDNLTRHSVSVLFYLEGGDPHKMQEIWPYAFRKKKKQSEFEYRLIFLETLGLIKRAQSDYRITPLGRAFLREARDHHDYHDVLSASAIPARPSSHRKKKAA